MLTVNSGEASQTSDRSGYQWVYGPIGAGNVTGTVDIRVRGRANTYVNIYHATAAIWVAKPDETVRGTCLSASTWTHSSLWTTSYANYSVTGQAISTVTASNGDYIVIEIGTVADFIDVDSFDLYIGDSDSSNRMYVEFNTSLPAYVSAPTNLEYTNDAQNLVELTAMVNMTPSAGGSAITSYTINSGALPAGVSLDASTGIISGTPTTAGSYSWVVRGTNAAGSDDSPTLTMVVVAAALEPPPGWTFDLRM